MKFKLRFYVTFSLTIIISSCIYDPPIKGKEIVIHNQTARPILVLDSLKGQNQKLYDTSLLNGRKYIWRKPNYVAEYSQFQHFIPDTQIQLLRRKNLSNVIIYFIDQSALENTLSQVSKDKSYRTLEVNLDSLEKNEWNHIFFTMDTVFIEHEFYQ